LRELHLSLMSPESIALGFFYWPLRNLVLLAAGCASAMMIPPLESNGVALILPLRWLFCFLSIMLYGILAIQATMTRSMLRWLSVVWVPVLGMIIFGLIAWCVAVDEKAFSWFWGPVTVAAFLGLGALWLRNLLSLGGYLILHRGNPAGYLRAAWGDPPKLVPLMGLSGYLGWPVIGGATRVAVTHVTMLVLLGGVMVLRVMLFSSDVSGSISMRDAFVWALVLLFATLPLRTGISIALAKALQGGLPLRGGAYQSSLFATYLPLLVIETTAVAMLIAPQGHMKFIEWLFVVFMLSIPLAGTLAGLVPLAVGAGRNLWAWLAQGAIPVICLVLVAVRPGDWSFDPEPGTTAGFLTAASVWNVAMVLAGAWAFSAWAYRRVMFGVPFGKLSTDPDRSGPMVPEEVVDRFAMKG
jgi:hypothetical protein